MMDASSKMCSLILLEFVTCGPVFLFLVVGEPDTWWDQSASAP